MTLALNLRADGPIAAKFIGRMQPYLASLRLKTALEKNGVDYQYFELPRSGHGLQNDTAISKQWMDSVEEYLARYMPVN